jgi:hypothetical protein
MSDTQHKRSSRRRRVLVAAVFASLAAVAIAEDVVVKQTVYVKSGKNTLAPTVATVPADTKLEIVKQEGSFVRVKTPDGIEGYVIRGDLPAGPKTTLIGGGDVTSLGAGGASRGLMPETEKYAASKNINPSIPKSIDKLIALCNSVTDDQLGDFAAQEHLGPKEYRK